MSCLASQVFAAGFQIQEQNVTNLGLAFSGTAALAEDATTGFFNPAGLTRLGESEIVLGATIIEGDFDFTATNAVSSFGIPIIAPAIAVPGGNEDDPGRTAGVPVFAVSKRIDDHWVFGFNVNAPWGLDTRYQQTGIVRYIATDTSLQTLNFSPSIAYEILPCLSFGAGADAEFAKAELYVQVGAGNAARDGFQKNRAEGWGYGWHAGLLWEFRESTRVGLNYRSHVNMKTEGNSEQLISLDAPSGAGTYVMRRVHANVTLPEIATLSLYHAFNQCYAITADVAWTNWSRFHTLKLRFDPLNEVGFGFAVLPPFPVSVDTDTWEHFKDARRYALGLIYTHSRHWLFRIGTAYDESPVRDEFRTARIPDENRYWAAIGGAYTVNDALRVDFGYAHIFFNDASLDEHAPFRAQTEVPISAARLVGSYDGSANIVGIQVRYDFV